MSAFLANGFSLRVRVATERKAEGAQERPAVVVRRGCGDDGDVHTADGVDLVVVDFGEDELLSHAERVVAAPIERVGAHASEVTDPGDGQTHEPVIELPH